MSSGNNSESKQKARKGRPNGSGNVPVSDDKYKLLEAYATYLASKTTKKEPFPASLVEIINRLYKTKSPKETFKSNANTSVVMQFIASSR